MNGGRRLRVVLLLTMLLLWVTPPPSEAQENEAGADTSVSSVSVNIRAGYGFPVGEWAAHRYAPVDQFGKGLTVGGDFEIRLTDKVGLGIVVDHTTLDMSDWEEYARAQGSSVDAEATLTMAAVTLRPYLRRKGAVHVKLEIGPAIAFPSGKERTDTYSYDYDFLKSPIFGILVGTEIEYFLSTVVSITARGVYAAFSGGADYADGYDRSIMSAHLAGGFRFHFGGKAERETP